MKLEQRMLHNALWAASALRTTAWCNCKRRGISEVAKLVMWDAIAMDG